jgi:uncharacterized protein
MVAHAHGERMTNQLIARYYEAFNTRDFEAYARLFTNDCLVEAPGVELRGIDGARGFDRAFLGGLPDGKITNLHMASGTNVVLCENRFRGTHTGAWPTADGSLPPTGRTFDESYTAVFEIAGERIKRQTLRFDRLRVAEVLGTDHVATVKAIYDAFPRGDIQFILDQCADDVSWGIESVAAAEVAPYGIRSGKAGVAKFFEAWGATADFTDFTATDFVAAGPHVFNVLHYSITVKATGKQLKCADKMQHWTFNQAGKLCRWRGAEDSAATRDAFRR